MARGRPPTLLLIDVQQGLDDPAWGPRNNPHAEARIAELLAAWRAASGPVVHVLHASQSPEGRLRADGPGHAPKATSRPAPSEPVHVKTVNSAFIGTTLEADLRAAGAEELVIVGLTTNHCVSTTVRMAANLGFTTWVVSDATAAFARPALDGRLRPADEVHLAALSDLRDEFARVIDSREALLLLDSCATNA
jgi:nicotinamidase-related amidase